MVLRRTTKRSKINSLEDQLTSFKRSSLYRKLKTVVVEGSMARIQGKEVIHLCSNDYLGLSNNTDVVKKTIEFLTTSHISPCSSRLVAGNYPKIIDLELKLAEHRQTEAALVYPTGYAANLGVVTALANKNCTIFSDELNHASIVDACKLSGARIEIFRHNEVNHLEGLLRGKPLGRKLVITEGIFSMDGDLSKLDSICRIARDYGAATIVDDSHGDFVIGSTNCPAGYTDSFSGTPSRFGVNSLVDVHISSMSKALGCFGGYAATTRSIRKLLINTSRQFIYTSALPEHLCVAASTAMSRAKKGDLQKKLFRNIKNFSSKITKLGFTVSHSGSQILPIMIGDEKLALRFSKELLKEGAFAQAIRYPSVRKGSARLRVTVSAVHSNEHLTFALHAFEIAGKRCSII